MNLDKWFATSSALCSNSVTSSVLQHLPAHGTLYDVGANVGVVTSAALEAGARVIAFEPHPVYRDYLERKCPEATVYPYALGAEFGTMTLYSDTGANHGWNTFVGEMQTDNMEQITVPVRPLDFLEPDKLDVLKVDVEGSEADVIYGAKFTVQRLKPVIVMELGWGTLHPHWDKQVEMMEWLIDSVGYRRVDYEIEGTQDVILVA